MEMGTLGFTKKRRIMRCSTRDIISDLPPYVLEKIVVCLTIQDAVRTSVLSRKWRYIWTTLPQIVFDDQFCRGMTRATTKELMMTIYKVLLLRHGPILKFTLTLANLESCPEMNQLICFLSDNGIRELTLHIRKGEPYKLPSTLFSCLQLEQLNLRSCVFRAPPGFEGFARLLSLELYEVVLAGDAFASLISSCPLLEQLTLNSCTSIDCLVIPNLKNLWCEGVFRSICCMKTTEVEDITIKLKGSRNQLGFDEGEISNSVMLLGSLPFLEFLILDYSYVKFMAGIGVRMRLPTTLNYLKELSLHDICFGEPDEVSIVLYLIRCSPNLIGISIRAFHGAIAAIDTVAELYDLQDVSLNKLDDVLMEEVSGTKAEMEFIKLLLAKSRRLRTMDIELKSKEVAEKFRIVKELIGFPRASPRAVITFPE